MPSFPHLSQPDSMDCGATCLAMLAKHYGKNYTIQKLREMCSATRAGVSMLGISDAAEALGFKTMCARLNFEKLANEVPLPCIVHWKQNHFVVVYDIKRRKEEGRKAKGIVRVADPGHGLIDFTVEEFCNNWLSMEKNGEDEGVALLLDPTPAFYEQEDEKSDRTKFSYIFRYLKPYHKYIAQLFLGLFLDSLISINIYNNIVSHLYHKIVCY